MAKYSELANVIGTGVTITESHLTSADAQVDALLFKKGIDPAAVILPNNILSEIARLYALNIAYIEKQASLNATQDEFLFFEKAKIANELLLNPLLCAVSEFSLGIRDSSATVALI